MQRVEIYLRVFGGDPKPFSIVCASTGPYCFLDKFFFMAFTKQEFLRLMHYPSEWTEWDMYPDELLKGQVGAYTPRSERASEHFRNGAFHWWLKRKPSKEQLMKLVRLSYLDPEELMGDDVRRYIAAAENCDDEIRQMFKAGSIENLS
jgi:hypothetical protein